VQGYTIPLDKRLAADGRGLQEVSINDRFAGLSEALYVAEAKAREAINMRSAVQRELLAKEKEKKVRALYSARCPCVPPKGSCRWLCPTRRAGSYSRSEERSR
jgi:SKIP/SNW domain